MKSSILTVLFLIVNSVYGQHVLVHENWRPKVVEGLAMVKKYDPDIFQQIVSRAYIQLADCSYLKALAFAIRENRAGVEIDWIMIDPRTIETWGVAHLAAFIVHEALHLKLWDHGNGKSWSTMTELEREQEHAYIERYQSAFLSKVNGGHKQR